MSPRPITAGDASGEGGAALTVIVLVVVRFKGSVNVIVAVPAATAFTVNDALVPVPVLAEAVTVATLVFELCAVMVISIPLVTETVPCWPMDSASAEGDATGADGCGVGDGTGVTSEPT